MKICRTCQQLKPESRYAQYRTICMDCRNETARIARLDRLERKALQLRAPQPTSTSNPWLNAHYPGRSFYDTRCT